MKETGAYNWVNKEPTVMHLQAGFKVSKISKDKILLTENGSKRRGYEFTPEDQYYPVLEKIISLEAYVQQVQWERDIAISQLKDLGYELGEICDKPKIDDCCKNCDIGLTPNDCSEHEITECRFQDAIKQYVAEFGTISALDNILTYMDSNAKLKTAHMMIDSMWQNLPREKEKK